MATTTVFEMEQVLMPIGVFGFWNVIKFLFFFQLNSKIDELSRLTESEYETNKAVSLFQYFDKIYTLCYGKPSFQPLVDTLIHKQYASKSNIC